MAYSPHQFCCRESSMSDRYTRGFDPSLLLRIEKNPCSPDATCVLWEGHMFQSSRLAHALVDRSTPSPSETCMIRERIDLLLCSLQFATDLTLASIECRRSTPWSAPLHRRVPKASGSIRQSNTAMPGAVGNIYPKARWASLRRHARRGPPWR